MDASDPARQDCDDHVPHKHHGAERSEQSEYEPAATGEFDQRDEECAGVRKRNMRLDHGLLHLAKLRWYEQFSAAGNAEEDASQDHVLLPPESIRPR